MMREKFDNDNGDAQSKAPPTVNNNNKQACILFKGLKRLDLVFCYLTGDGACKIAIRKIA